ncbi:MAG: hypothetical protein RR320_06605, partial [Oscillospiraceae bacterium]
MDEVADYDSLAQADLEIKASLRRHAAESIDQAIDIMRRSGGLQSIQDVIEQCRQPIFVSVVAQSMSEKA